MVAAGLEDFLGFASPFDILMNFEISANPQPSSPFVLPTIRAVAVPDVEPSAHIVTYKVEWQSVNGSGGTPVPPHAALGSKVMMLVG